MNGEPVCPAAFAAHGSIPAYADIMGGIGQANLVRSDEGTRVRGASLIRKARFGWLEFQSLDNKAVPATLPPPKSP
jgi:hypothetical protein